MARLCLATLGASITIAISLKVNDGLVLATDSASTLASRSADGTMQVINIYGRADRVMNLKKGLPIGVVVWGTGAIGERSVSNLLKDLRDRFSRPTETHEDWCLDDESYTIEQVAERVREFVFDENFVPAFTNWPEKPTMGMIVGGYSAGDSQASEFQINIGPDGTCAPPIPLRGPSEAGITWGGETEAMHRLVLGFGSQMPQLLVNNLGLSENEVGPALDVLKQALGAPLVQPGMPFQDAIRLAEFLVRLTIGFSEFAPGAPTVGGDIDIAAITKHEGFRWVQRKHYYSSEFNQPNGEDSRE